MTNNHVVENADQLEVTLADGTKVPAKLQGTDVWTDLAVIEIDGSKVKEDDIAEFGNSDKLKAGEPVIAIGNRRMQFSGSGYTRCRVRCRKNDSGRYQPGRDGRLECGSPSDRCSNQSG